MKKIIIIAVLLSVTVLGCIGQNNSEKIKTDNLKEGNEWCKEGSKITSVGSEGNLTTFYIKGITNHNGLELCEADYDNNGTMIQYFNKNKTYNIMSIKTDNGTQEIDVNRVNK